MKHILLIAVLFGSYFVMVLSCNKLKEKKHTTSVNKQPLSDTTVKQIVFYGENKYWLRTWIETPEITRWFNNTYNFSGMPNSPFEKTISGSYYYILDNKNTEYQKADSFLHYYKIAGYKQQLKNRSQAKIDSAIADSIKMLEGIKTTPSNILYPTFYP